jgi:hypothetical protein
MGSSPTGRSVYSPDSTSPSIPISRTFQMRQEDADPSSINAHVQPRPYQPQQVRPYGHNPNGYLPDNRAMVSATDGQRPTAYMAVPLMDQQGSLRWFLIVNYSSQRTPSSSPHDGKLSHGLSTFVLSIGPPPRRTDSTSSQSYKSSVPGPLSDSVYWL